MDGSWKGSGNGTGLWGGALVGLGLLVCVGSATAQEPDGRAAPGEAPASAFTGASAGVPVALARLQGPVVLDGLSNEAAWQAVAPVPLVQYWPDYNGTMTLRTEIRLAYDDNYLYASGRFYDDPELVRGTSLLRDRSRGDDAFDLIIDSFNDDQTALRFSTTPRGILVDEEIRNNAEFGAGAGPFNIDWNTYWDAETQITEEGWFVEMRVPFASLGFSVDEGRAVMGVIASRYIARKNEKHIFPAIAPEWQVADFKPSLAQDVVLEGVEEQTRLWMTPYVLTGVERTREADATPPRAPTSTYPGELGVDVKYGLSSNLTLDLTANTDFAQVESDDIQVNLDRFNLFVPEKRQFFQERSSAFEFSIGSEGQLFHSRRIGLSSVGTPVRIFGGARLAGRVGAWDVGLLSLQVDGDLDDPGENDSVLRLRRGLRGDGRIGGMLTSRIDGRGGADVTYGLDAEIPIASERLTLQWAQSINQTESEGSVLDQGFARLFWERRNLDGLGYDLSLDYSGADFEPRLGFESRDDFSSVRSRVTWAWRPSAESPVARFRVNGVGRAFWRNSDGVGESLLGRLQMFTEFKNGHFLNVTGNLVREDVAEGFTLPGASVPAGRYSGADLFVYFEMNRGSRLSTSVRLWTGQTFDGHRVAFDVQPRWVVSPGLSIAPRYEYHRVWFPSRGERVNADIAAVRVQAALNPSFSAEAVVQYSAPADALVSNLRLRYRFAEGRDLFVVLDEGRDLVDRHGIHSAILGRADRRLLIKYTYAIRP